MSTPQLNDLLQAIFEVDHGAPKAKPDALKKLNLLLDQAIASNPQLKMSRHELLRALRSKYWEVLARQDNRQSRVGRIS